MDGDGAEIWGWEEKEGMERLRERYLRWVLGVDKKTPGYMVKEELERDKLGERAGRRALKRGRGRRGRMSRQENV